MKFVLGRAENIVGKEENAGYQHFLLFAQCFQTGLCDKELKGHVFLFALWNKNFLLKIPCLTFVHCLTGYCQSNKNYQ